MKLAEIKKYFVMYMMIYNAVFCLFLAQIIEFFVFSCFFGFLMLLNIVCVFLHVFSHEIIVQGWHLSKQFLRYFPLTPAKEW